MKKIGNEKICILGLWHQGCVACACLADFGYSVVGLDKNFQHIHRLSQGIAPLFEPHLNELLLKGIQSHRLSFSTDIKKHIQESSFIFMMFDTPMDDQDNVHVNEFHETMDTFIPYLKEEVIILVTAQVPVGTCDTMVAKIRQVRPHLHFGLAYAPENLRLGTAIEHYRHPSLPVLGSNTSWVLDKLENIFSVFNTQFLRVDLKTAEMTKHALNAFLATSISFGNEIGNLCDKIGANAFDIAQALRMEPRVGSKAMLFPGLGFSGGTLARDLQVLRSLGDKTHTETAVLDGVLKTNEIQNQIIVYQLENIFGSLKNLPITILGLTYKANTSTLRRSAALKVISELIKRGASIKAHDPCADREEIKQHSEFLFYEDPYTASSKAHALVIMTQWQEYSHLDFEKIKEYMTHPIILDPHGICNPKALNQLNFKYVTIGQGQ